MRSVEVVRLDRLNFRRIAEEVAGHVRSLLTHTDQSTKPGVNTPLTLRSLQVIGGARGIASYEFDAPIPAEGRLVPLPTGDFKVRIRRSAASARARFSLAHEIGHTFFSKGAKWAERLSPVMIDNPTKGEEKDAELVERFCDAFAAELLFPGEAARRELSTCATTAEPAALLEQLERAARRWSVSVETVAARVNRVACIPKDAGIIVLRWKQHSSRKGVPALRVSQFLPKPARGWYIPTDQRAQSVGLRGALELHRQWETFPRRQAEREYQRSGVWSFEYRDQKPVIFENEPRPTRQCREQLNVWYKDPFRSWCRVVTEATLAYRFYASNAVEAYALAVVRFR